jgi:hypothetical protein
MSGYTSDLLLGLAQLVSDASVGIYRATGGYVATDTGIFIKGLPDFPDRAISITTYATSDMVKIAQTTVRVQFWLRGVPNNTLDVDDIGDAIFALVQGMENRDFGTAHVIQAYRTSSGQLGADTANRSQRSDNYQFDLNVPPTAGRPD